MFDGTDDVLWQRGQLPPQTHDDSAFATVGSERCCSALALLTAAVPGRTPDGERTFVDVKLISASFFSTAPAYQYAGNPGNDVQGVPATNWVGKSTVRIETKMLLLLYPRYPSWIERMRGNHKRPFL
jgi:hypothetical protein